MQSSGDRTSAETTDISPATSVQPGRNIILLSDGTGNSAAKLNKTNVWRLYQALELGDGTQIAFYDHGVGTSGFKPMRLLGGAFGIGLARNVRDLYRLLCEHYRAPDNHYSGDRIYIFGFSRGAFTARILADLISSCGILDPRRSVPKRGFSGVNAARLGMNTDAGLKRGVKLAYKAYRRKYKPPLFAPVYRWLRDLLLGAVPDVDSFRDSYSYRHDEPIAAVGVWDTVAAYGLPVDEFSNIVDRLFYKLRFSGHALSPKVARAYHALAIDDERQSFLPLLWDESKATDRERIQQVWFPGVHADVGGGYPNGELSLLSLNWMVRALRRRPDESFGLVFSEHALKEIERRAAVTAPMHDSRSGLAIYYRYRPRMVDDLSQDKGQPFVVRAKIHKSAMARISLNTDGYAPRGLPVSYELVDDDGKALTANSYETDDHRARRERHQMKAGKHIFWRRLNYQGMVAATAALLLVPAIHPPVPKPTLSGFQIVIDEILKPIAAMLPEFLSRWTAAWTQSPYWFTALVVLIAALVFNARRLARLIHGAAEAGWVPIKGLTEGAPSLSEKLPQRRPRPTPAEVRVSRRAS